jgi:hypothetical protein
MFKQLNAGIFSLCLLSIVATPAIAETAFDIPLENNSRNTENIAIEDYSSLYSSLTEGESLETSTVKSTLDFSDISQEVTELHGADVVAQRRTRTRSKYKYSAGLDTINFGWVNDDNGAISSILGFNLGLGIGYRKYFKPVQEGKFNFSWDVGTVLLLFPFAGVGADYQWDSGWYVGARALFFPGVLFIDDFFWWPVWPTLSGGYRWK